MLILATTDGSPRSERALPHAAHFAKALDAELLLLRVLDPRVDCASDRSPTLAAAAERVAARWTVELEEQAESLDAPTQVDVAIKGRREDVSAVILRTVQERRARLLAMATRGGGLVRSALLGSVATSVMRKAETPVMLAGDGIRPPAGALPYHIVITTDGSQAASTVLPAARRILQQAPRENVRLTLLRLHVPAVGDPPDVMEIRRRELTAFKRNAPRRFPLASELREHGQLGGTHRGILRAAKELDANAIWMASHGHSFRRRVLLGSVALATVRQAEIPVIVTRATA